MGNRFGVGVPACGSPGFGAENWRNGESETTIAMPSKTSWRGKTIDN